MWVFHSSSNWEFFPGVWVTSSLSVFVYLLLFLTSFSHQQMVFHWSLSNTKPLQVTRTFPSIIADLNNAVVQMVSARLSNASGPFTKPLRIVPSTTITIGITITFMFHNFFSSQARSKYLSLFLFSIPLCDPHGWQSPLVDRFSSFY